MKTTPKSRPVRRSVMVSLAAIFATVIAGCSSDDSAEEPASGSTQALPLSVLQTGYPTTPDSLPVLVAEQKGYFTQAGVKIGTIAGGPGGGASTRNMLGAGIEVGSVSAVAAIQASLEGGSLKIIASSGEGVAHQAFVTRKDSPIKDIKDLVGKKVAFTRAGSASQGVLNASLRAAGIDPSKVTGVAAGSVENGLAALRGGGVDAAFTQSPTYQTDPAPYKIVFWVDQYVSDFTLVLTVATPEVLESKPDAVRRYLAARQKAVDFIYANPAESAQIMATGLRVPLAAAKTTVKQYNDNKQWTAYGLSVNGINSAVDVAISVGALKPDAKIPWTKMIDQQFIPKDQQIDVGQLKNGG